MDETLWSIMSGQVHMARPIRSPKLMSSVERTKPRSQPRLLFLFIIFCDLLVNCYRVFL